MKQPEAPAGLGSVERWFALFDHLSDGVGISDESFRVWVRDNGPGIDARHLPRLFDRFCQAEARRGGATQGTGLGLAFAKQALEAMGARIFVTSDKGAATEFSIVFPDC